MVVAILDLVIPEITTPSPDRGCFVVSRPTRTNTGAHWKTCSRRARILIRICVVKSQGYSQNSQLKYWRFPDRPRATFKIIYAYMHSTAWWNLVFIMQNPKAIGLGFVAQTFTHFYRCARSTDELSGKRLIRILAIKLGNPLFSFFFKVYFVRAHCFILIFAT